MRSESFAADKDSDASPPDPRLALILSLFRLFRTVAPEPVILQRLVDEVRRTEIADDSDDAGSSPELTLQRTILCEAAVRRFITTVA